MTKRFQNPNEWMKENDKREETWLQASKKIKNEVNELFKDQIETNILEKSKVEKEIKLEKEKLKVWMDQKLKPIYHEEERIEYEMNKEMEKKFDQLSDLEQPCCCTRYQKLEKVITAKECFIPIDSNFAKWLQWAITGNIEFLKKRNNDKNSDSEIQYDISHMAKHNLDHEFFKNHFIVTVETACFPLCGNLSGYKGDETVFGPDYDKYITLENKHGQCIDPLDEEHWKFVDERTPKREDIYWPESDSTFVQAYNYESVLLIKVQ